LTAQTPHIPQIIVLDTGGQYCHLIARRVRELGVYAEVRRSDVPAAELQGALGVIISGGPASVYDQNSPRIDAQILNGGVAVLGICYGLQLMAQALGASVTPGAKGEYGLATLHFEDGAATSALLSGLTDAQQIWMSHKDVVATLPAGFSRTGSTATCAVAVIEKPERALYGVQFHPEVVHTTQGRELLSNFVFGIAGCSRDWDPAHQPGEIEKQIRDRVGDRSVFFFVSGGVDSTVAYTLCLRALGPERVRGVYVDTGLMRDGETLAVEQMFARLGGEVAVEQASSEFLGALAGARDPEAKRAIIGEAFVAVQERIIDARHLLDGHWILGQGTIYPDTIESGGTSQAAVIKTHHNRVEGIQKLIEQGRIVEPLSSYYKDEVRAIGMQLGLPAEYLERHPFPGPGLAIRCLCSEVEAEVVPRGEAFLVPVRSVGVQGDFRTYAPVLATPEFPSKTAALQNAATELVNGSGEINRVIALVDSVAPITSMRVWKSTVTPERIARLREADRIVREMSHASGFDREIWQFPVVMIPMGIQERPDSIVLRPVDSMDGMTAQSVSMDEEALAAMAAQLLNVDGVAAVFYDLTHKPPATIEWE
jgi:GMP synthase (glutamine-hydrolysing)